jgi:hypothetical protein
MAVKVPASIEICDSPPPDYPHSLPSSLQLAFDDFSFAMAAEDIYGQEMYSLGRGFALWQADPLDGYECVKVGDTGYIQCVIDRFRRESH